MVSRRSLILTNLLFHTFGVNTQMFKVKLCKPETVIQGDLLRCGSCQGRCGTLSDYDDRDSDFYHCSCDRSCSYYGDCCQDVQGACPEVFQDFRNVSGLYQVTRNFRDFECREFFTEGEISDLDDMPRKPFSSLIITTCSDGSGCEFREYPDEDVNSFVPMYEVNKEVHYISGHCALCNGAKDVIPWEVMLNCDGIRHEKDYINTGLVNSTESLNHIMIWGDCRISYKPSGPVRSCGPVIPTCDPDCENEDLISMCDSDFESVTSSEASREVYRNEYCAMCNKEMYVLDLCPLLYGDYGQVSDYAAPWPSGSFSLTLVFDFDPRNGLTVGEHPLPKCSTKEVYVPDEGICRAIMCPSGLVLDGLDCIPEPSNITLTVTGQFTAKPSSEMLDTLDDDLDHLENTIKDDIYNIMETHKVIHQNLQLISAITVEEREFKVELVIQCNCGYGSLSVGNNSNDIQIFEQRILEAVRKEVTIYLISRYFYVNYMETDVVLNINNSRFLNSEQNNCKWLIYHKNQTESGNKTVTVVSTGRTYEFGMFEDTGEDVIVCESDFSRKRKTVSDSALTLDIISLICVGISIICLVIRIILQFFITNFQKRKGILQLQLVIALLLAFLMLVIGPFMSKNSGACTTAAILMAYGFFGSFSWMNVIACETSIIFLPSSAFLRANEEDRPLYIHFICGWGIPLLLVILSVVMNYSDINIDFRPEFGGDRCWYARRYAMLIFFGIPIAISILLNIVFFIHTSINLRRAFKNSPSAVGNQDTHYIIYVRLFVIMGITWICGFISAFTGHLALQIIFIFFNALQGLFLFMSFVCNKAVLSEIRKKRKKNSSTSNTPENKTKNTPTSSSTEQLGDSKTESKV